MFRYHVGQTFSPNGLHNNILKGKIRLLIAGMIFMTDDRSVTIGFFLMFRQYKFINDKGIPVKYRNRVIIHDYFKMMLRIKIRNAERLQKLTGLTHIVISSVSEFI